MQSTARSANFVFQISSPPMMASATSMESLNAFPELPRRASASRSSQSSAFDALFLSEEDGIGISSAPNSSNSPCVPTVVMMCIRHLEQFGLHTVGIFRVSSSKRRVRQVRTFVSISKDNKLNKKYSFPYQHL